jgi:hypothetical protein
VQPEQDRHTVALFLTRVVDGHLETAQLAYGPLTSRRYHVRMDSPGRAYRNLRHVVTDPRRNAKVTRSPRGAPTLQ